MSEIEPVAATRPETPAETPTATSPPDRRKWWIAAAVALVAVLLVAAVATTALVVDDDDDSDTVLVVDDGDVISRDRAERLALEAVGGGTVTELQLDDEDGRVVYEVEVSDPSRPGADVDVVIDARIGDVLTTDS
jgi:uncharacterized membrane protein YkoI